MDIHTLDDLQLTSYNGGYASGVVRIPALGGLEADLDFQEFIPEADSEAFLSTVQAFLALDRAAFQAMCEPYLFEYYQDMMRVWDPAPDEYRRFQQASDVWGHIRIHEEIVVSRLEDDDKVYIDLSGHCDWEPEHGLQISLCEGRQLSRVGYYSGRAVNSDGRIYSPVSAAPEC